MLTISYVSRPSIPSLRRTRVLDDIRAVSIARNSQLGITGLLIVTAMYFAQVLEGPEDAVDDVMKSILADPRHHEIVVVRRDIANRRRFPLWRMARFEHETFADASLSPLLAELHTKRGGAALRRFDRLLDDIRRSRCEPSA
ncbi:BLUF domain-containing protein [Altererythrobacter sp. KTW20L]|uniref:BLUF domain-containing protein n=1 Tax=Altererythrobacter sp. KTW20L TaxID=2942210 RepID=UPI0020BD8D15|nr:BLUF domain-containing protein [Altererythrobacter sp. KTW20L]MCL6251238.1 BLUF domain-containing protein [Altererythrobacter sp. KTW20L]